MLITDGFVFLHIPKTAGTFVHKVLRDLYCPSPAIRKVHSLRRVTGITIPLMRYSYREMKKHMVRRHVPEACDGSRPVVLAVRNPLDHYVSHFHFNWWRRFAHRWFRDVAEVEREFGPISEFDFTRFALATIQFASWREQINESNRRPLGPDSAEWVRYFCTAPQVAISKPTESELVAEVRQQMSDVVVLYMESLNSDLKAFLIDRGFKADRLSFLDQAKRVYPGKITRSDGGKWSKYYTADLAQKVMNAEWLLFELFPKYADSLSAIHA